MIECKTSMQRIEKEKSLPEGVIFMGKFGFQHPPCSICRVLEDKLLLFRILKFFYEDDAYLSTLYQKAISGKCIWKKCWIMQRQAQEYLEAKMHRPMKKAFIIFLLIPIFTTYNSENKLATIYNTGKIQTIFPQNQDQADTVNDAEAGERKTQGNDAEQTDARKIGAVAVSTYEQHEPILIENIQATVDDPYIVEGYEISSNEANCIEIRNSKNIIIRGNYLHDCTFYTDEYPGGWQEGHSIYAENSESITIEDNLVEDNTMGPYVRHSNSVKIMNNSVSVS